MECCNCGLGHGGAGVLPQAAARRHGRGGQAGDDSVPEESTHGVCKLCLDWRTKVKVFQKKPLSSVQYYLEHT